MSAQEEPPHISKKQAIKLAKFKPSKNQTRDDLLVYGGWLSSRWEWSRDVDKSLDDAIANARKLGEDVRIVGNPKPEDRKKVKGKKPPKLQPEGSVPEKTPGIPKQTPWIVAPQPPSVPEPSEKGEAVAESLEAPPPLVTPEGERQEMIAPLEPNVPAAQSRGQTETAPRPPKPTSLLFQRFFIAAALCSFALFLGYYRLAGSVYVSILLLADAFFILGTSLVAIRDRWGFGGKRKSAPVPGSQNATVGGSQ